MTFARAALVGCGMVGGSLMAALRAAAVVERVVGFDRAAAHAEAARSRGLVDEVAPDAASAARGAQLVVLAVPVGATAEVCAAIAGAVAEATLVTDVGSTKTDVVAAAEAGLPDAARFCGAHPMAGTEKSGPAAADAALFQGKLAILTPTARTSPAARAACADLWKAAGARTREMTPAAHDRAMAWVSHLPHVVAFALASAVGGDEFAGLAGGGFADTTRIAASDPAMWRDIFLANRAALLDAIHGFEGQLAALRAAIESGDPARIEGSVLAGRSGRARVLR
ncbi:MAG TPA: prephenate dehydrogenase/arogenate dehydrogenase family protein [Polyangia bacterium]|nr:prephenate dehydrogenase/arogenate dehydrogenase family protein [Polyangia bacterium]